MGGLGWFGPSAFPPPERQLHAHERGPRTPASFAKSARGRVELERLGCQESGHLKEALRRALERLALWGDDTFLQESTRAGATQPSRVGHRERAGLRGFYSVFGSSSKCASLGHGFEPIGCAPFSKYPSFLGYLLKNLGIHGQYLLF